MYHDAKHRRNLTHPMAASLGAAPDFGLGLAGSSSSSVSLVSLERKGYMFMNVDKQAQLVPTAAERASAPADTPAAATSRPTTSTEWVPAVKGSAGVRYERGGRARVLKGVGDRARYRRACDHPGCSKMTRPGPTVESRRFCRMHGGGVFCNVPGCRSGAKAGYQTCIRHGAGNRCQIQKNHPENPPHAYRRLGQEPIELSGHFETPRPEFANLYCCSACLKKFR